VDPRDAQKMFGDMLPSGSTFDETTMTLTILREDDEGIETELKFQCHYEACDVCQGRGKHVNPSIDAHGITYEEFEADPDFREEYMSGMYDEVCSRCKGERVAPEVTRKVADEAALKWLDEWIQDEASYRHTCAMERRMGA